eukprot:COSAG01_NODE_37748_length_499_cov_1.030000_1_plen_62_part_01
MTHFRFLPYDALLSFLPYGALSIFGLAAGRRKQLPIDRCSHAERTNNSHIPDPRQSQSTATP